MTLGFLVLIDDILTIAIFSGIITIVLKLLWRYNIMDVAALVIGIVSIVIALIPCFGVFASIISVLGIIFGFLGIIFSKKKGMAIAGLVLSIVALFIALFWAVIIGASASVA